MRQMEVHTRVVAKVASQRRNCRKESVMLPGRGIANLDLWLAALHEMNEDHWPRAGLLPIRHTVEETHKSPVF